MPRRMPKRVNSKILMKTAQTKGCLWAYQTAEQLAGEVMLDTADNKIPILRFIWD